MQTSAPAPARARMHAALSCCAVARGGAKKPGAVVVRRQAWLRRTCVVLAAGTAAADVAGVVAVRVVRVARSTRVAASITVILTPSFALARSIAIVTLIAHLVCSARVSCYGPRKFIAFVSRIAWSIIPFIFVKPDAAPYIPPVIAGMVAACVAVTVVGIACLTRVTAGTRRGRSAVCTRPVGQTWPAATASHQLWSQSVIPLSCRRPTPQLPPLQLPSLVTGASCGI